MKNKLIALYLVFPFLFSCSHYLYEGRIVETGVDGKDHIHIISWNATDYLFGIFDKAGDINLMTCGSPELYTFSDDSGKIVFIGDPSKLSTPPGLKTKGGICGAILGHEIIDLIPEGKLKVAVYCEPKSESWALAKSMALRAQRKPYIFDIKRIKSKEPAKCEQDKEAEETKPAKKK